MTCHPTPGSPVPAETLAAVIDMIEDRYDGTVCQRDYDVITAAAPHITARATAAERERCIQLARKYARVWAGADATAALNELADLLAAAPEERP